MIVTHAVSGTRTVRDGRVRITSRSLARRGFFYSETESFDHLRLAPGAEIDARGRDGTEEIWLITEGAGRLSGADGSQQPLRRYDLVVCPYDSASVLGAGPEGMAAVLVSVVPDRLTGAMPTRLPAA